MPLQHRRGYAADLHRGLPTSDITQPRSSPRHPDGQSAVVVMVRVRAAIPAPIRQVRAGGSLERRSAAGSSRAPFRLACRARTIWQYWPASSLSGAASTLPGVSRIGRVGPADCSAGPPQNCSGSFHRKQLKQAARAAQVCGAIPDRGQVPFLSRREDLLP
jgi:hypothetical protein